MLDFLATLGAWNWIVLAVLLLVLETVIPGVHFVWFGTAAMIVGSLLIGIELISPETAMAIGWQVQTIVFATLSMVTIFFFRGFAGTGFNPSDLPNLNVRGRQYIGRSVIVASAIKGGRGKVRIEDTLWVAEGPDTPEGAMVRITDIDGTVMKVKAN